MAKNKTRGGGTLSEAQYWGKVRSALRKAFQYWPVAMEAKKRNRVPYHGDNKRRKWVYRCEKCLKYFPDGEVQIDHIKPVGSLKTPDDIATFLERLTPEDPMAYQLLCKKCHHIKTQQERKK